LPNHDDRLRLESLEWLCEIPLRHGEPLKARLRFRTRASLKDVSIGLGFSTTDGRRLLTYETDFQKEGRPMLDEAGGYAVEIELESLPLAPDFYLVDIGSRSGDTHSLDYVTADAPIEIIAGPTTPGYIMRKNAGVRLSSKWTWLDHTGHHESLPSGKD